MLILLCGGTYATAIDIKKSFDARFFLPIQSRPYVIMMMKISNMFCTFQFYAEKDTKTPT